MVKSAPELLRSKQHQILKSLIPHGYTGIDPGLKVQHLNSGIKTSTLDAVRTQIILDESLRTDFARCVTLYKDFVKTSVNPANVRMGIAALNITTMSGRTTRRTSKLQSERPTLLVRPREKGGKASDS
jgi:hypothetical protein